MTVVIDSSVCIGVLIGDLLLPDGDLVAPAFLDSEVLATLRRLEWGGVSTNDETDDATRRLPDIAIRRIPALEISRAALDVARLLGWARTYDAEYVALARDRDAVLVSADAKLRRGAARLIRTAEPTKA